MADLDVSGTVLARYTQGSGIDEPLASVTGLGAAFFEADGIGSVTSLSGASGVTDTYTYKPFGITTANGSNPNRFRFTGREWDQETGLYYYRARYYDPNIGRFISEDSIGFMAGPNFYAYVENRPVLLVDPFGFEGSLKKDDPGLTPEEIRELEKKMRDPNTPAREREQIKRRLRELRRRPSQKAHGADKCEKPKGSEMADQQWWDVFWESFWDGVHQDQWIIEQQLKYALSSPCSACGSTPVPTPAPQPLPIVP